MLALENIALAGAAVPEPKWTWRRIAVFGGLIATMLMLFAIVVTLARLGDAGALKTIALWLITKQLIIYAIYLVAPSAEYVGKVTEMIRSVRP